MKIIIGILKLINAFTLILTILVVRILVKMSRPKHLPHIWWYYVNWIYLRPLRIYDFCILLKNVFLMIILALVMTIVSISFFAIFLIILEDSFFNFSFFACNKALVFFLFFCLVYLLLYDDTEFYKVFSEDYDDFENRWQTFNYDLLEDFENDPESLFVDFEEDLDLEVELDDTEFSWVNANLIDEGLPSNEIDDDEDLKEDLISNLYFYEHWSVYSSRFQKNLLVNEDPNNYWLADPRKGVRNFSNFYYINTLNLENIIFQSNNQFDEGDFFLKLYNLEAGNKRLSDTMLLSLFKLDPELKYTSHSDFTFGHFIINDDTKYSLFFSFKRLEYYNYGLKKKYNQYKPRPINEHTDIEWPFYTYLIKKTHYYFVPYHGLITQINDVEPEVIFTSLAPSYKNRYISEDNFEVQTDLNEHLEFLIDEDEFILMDPVDTAYELKTKFNIKRLDNTVNFFFRLLLQYKADFGKNTSIFYFKNRLLTFVFNNYFLFFFNFKFLKEIIYRRQLFFLLNLMQYNKSRYSTLLTFFLKGNLLIDAFKIKDSFSEPLYSYSFNWMHKVFHYFNLKWLNDENIMYEAFLTREIFTSTFGSEINGFIRHSKRKKERLSLLSLESTWVGFFYLRCFFGVEDFFFWLFFGPSWLYKKLKTPYTSFVAFYKFFLQLNAQWSSYLLNERVFFYPYLFVDLYESRVFDKREKIAQYKIHNTIRHQPRFIKGLLSLGHFSMFNSISSAALLHEIFIGLGYYNVKLLNNVYFNNPNLSRIRKSWSEQYITNYFNMFSRLSFVLPSNSLKETRDSFANDTFDRNTEFWSFFDEADFSFLNKKFAHLEEEVFSLLLNRLWNFEYFFNKEQFILEQNEDLIEGYGSTLLIEENGDISTDEFDLIWDWTVLNWELLTEINNDIDEFFAADDYERSLESGTSYYLYVLCLALFFWAGCKLHQFANHESPAFRALIPLYRTARFTDVFRFYFNDVAGTGRNRSLGVNFIGETKILMQHPGSMTDDFLRTGYFPFKQYESVYNKDFATWLGTLNYNENYVKSHLYLTNGLLTFRRPNSFFRKNSLLWLKYARLNRGLSQDYFGFAEKDLFLKNLRKNFRKLRVKLNRRPRIVLGNNAFKTQERLMLEEEERDRYRPKKKKKKSVFRYGLLNRDLFSTQRSRLNSIKRFAKGVEKMNGRFNSGVFLRFHNLIENENLDFQLGFKRQTQRSTVEDLLKVSSLAYREGLRLFLFGTHGSAVLDYSKKQNRYLTENERENLFERFLNKIKPLNRFEYYDTFKEKFSLHKKKLYNPVVFENVLIKLFLRRLKKSHDFRVNPYKPYRDFVEEYLKRKTKKREPLREPDLDYVSKVKGAIKTLGLHAFFLDLEFQNTFNSKKNRHNILFENENIARSHHSGIYGSILKNFIQYRYDVRSNFLNGINRAPYIFKILNSMSVNERNFVLSDLGVLKYLFNLLNGFLGEEFLYYNSPVRLDKNTLNLKNKNLFFKWYESIFKNPFNNFKYLDTKHLNKKNSKNVLYNLLFNTSDLTWDVDEDFEKFMFKAGFFNELEFYLRYLTREYVLAEDLTIWYDFYEGEQLSNDYYLMFLMPNFFASKMRSFGDNTVQGRKFFFDLIGSVRQSPKYGVFYSLLCDLLGVDVTNLKQAEIRNWRSPSGKILNRMLDVFFADSLISAVSTYNFDKIKMNLATPPPIREHYSTRPLLANMEEAHLWENIPAVFYWPEILYFNNKRDFHHFNKNLVPGYRNFNKKNYGTFFYEDFFNLSRARMDHIESEAGYNRPQAFGLDFKIPFQQLYLLEDLATQGGSYSRWYLGSIGDDLYPDVRRSLSNTFSMLWPYILRHAVGLPQGELPLIKLSNTGGITPSATINAGGYNFYRFRIRESLNPESFEDTGYEDLNYPAEEESLGFVFMKTFARFLVAPLIRLYSKMGKNLLDYEYINNFGGNLEQRPLALRKFAFKSQSYDKDIQDIISKEFGTKNVDTNIRKILRLPRLEWYDKSKFYNYFWDTQPWLLSKFDRFYRNNATFSNERDRLNIDYVYHRKFIYTPLRAIFNSFNKAGAGFIFFIICYALLYYLVWVPWMYFFYSINVYLDSDYGKDEPTSDDIKEDMDELEEDEKEDLGLDPSIQEPVDVGARHVILWGAEIADLIASYYDPLVFDYTDLVEPPYFFHLYSNELIFYGSSIFNIARNELCDLHNISIYDSSQNMSFSILDVKAAAEKQFILKGFRGPKPQYSVLFTEFISLLTGFEVDEGDIQEEYLDLAYSDTKIFTKFPTSDSFYKFVDEDLYLGEGLYIKDAYDAINSKIGHVTEDMKYNSFRNMGRFNYNDPFNMNSVRTTVWMSLRFLIRGLDSLGINPQIYEHNDLWSYVLPVEQKSNKIFFNELLSFLPKGLFGFIERGNLQSFDLQYKNGEMILPVYFRFFRLEDSYGFNEMGGISDLFLEYLEGVGRRFLKKTINNVNVDVVSEFSSIHDLSIVQPSNYEGLVSHELLFGILYLFQQFVYEHSTLTYSENFKIRDFILENYTFEINSLYNSEFVDFLHIQCSYTWSDWLIFFEESTDWALSYDNDRLIEIEDDPGLSLSLYEEGLKARNDLFDETEGKNHPVHIKWLEAEALKFKKILEKLNISFSDELFKTYVEKVIKYRGQWLFEDSIETLAFVIDEDDYSREGPLFPDSDTAFSYYLLDYQYGFFSFADNYKNLLFFNIFSKQKVFNDALNEQNLINDVFLQFLTMQFVDFTLIFDHFQRLNSYGNAVQLKTAEISTYQNNIYFGLKFNRTSHTRFTSIIGEGSYNYYFSFYFLFKFFKIVFYILLILMFYIII